MKLCYLDTSAALKFVVLEPEREALLDYVEDPQLVLVSSWLLYTEMLCASGRRPEQLSEEIAKQALDAVEFVDVSRHDLISASRLAPLRSNDAIHLAVASRLQVDEILTYDHELIEAASRLGIAASSPR